MSETVKYISVRFQTTNKTYTFSTTDDSIRNGDAVIVETQRGIEYARVIADPFDKPNISLEIKPILRKATEADREQYQQNVKDCESAKVICQEESDKLGLGMNILSAEYTLDRAKITFIYLADDRVDFRELLKVLASIFKCRIDLRQVGTRDKAKMVSGVGPCGRELCCARYITEFDRISINMAKNQLLALNVQKLSGQCGNLMCCLKYEDDAYKELRKGLPKMNSVVEYDGERYRITSMNVIARTCKLENQDHAIYLTLDDLRRYGKYQTPNVKKEEESEGTESVSEE
ncbi:MAG: stage 0 sporulation protein [Erysipelotrichaceae bacterium]|nr:stage 0 sporulation protein [Erysipelotrichaceae bacterium]